MLVGFTAFVVGTMAFAGAAFACHPEITAAAACGGHVTFTSTAWATSDGRARTNPTIQISYSTNNGSSFTTLPQKPEYKYNSANGYAFSDAFDLAAPLPASVIVKAKAIGTWGNGDTTHDSRQTTAVPVTACSSASIGDVVCSKGGATATLTNPTNSPVTFTVLKGTTTVGTVNVPAKSAGTKDVAIGEDETATITVKAENMADVTKTVTRDCEHPAGSIGDVVCANGGATVTLTNLGGQLPVHFVIKKDGTEVAAADVPADGTVTKQVAVAEDTTAAIKVSAPGMSDVTKSVHRDCEAPPAETPPTDNPPTETPVNNPPTTPNTPVIVIPTAVKAAVIEAPAPTTPTATPSAAAARQTEVLGVQVTAPVAQSAVVAAAPLARTGSSRSMPLSVVAFGMISLGMMLAGATRLHHRRSVDFIDIDSRLG